ncbi:hypothetical protein EVAR_38740_1 [Eumeta japonica]|uniref:Uncharacterized protein n=1 Tax=Eumeta variegata TaxID=151549 RepID=A0A4C1YL61_EUMVA|nr:hypothetical protein EVAR_38740_1 [Eumeta japonica]
MFEENPLFLELYIKNIVIRLDNPIYKAAFYTMDTDPTLSTQLRGWAAAIRDVIAPVSGDSILMSKQSVHGARRGAARRRRRRARAAPLRPMSRDRSLRLNWVRPA